LTTLFQYHAIVKSLQTFFFSALLMQISFVTEVYIILYVYVYKCIKLYLYRIDIELCKFVNKFTRFQITIYNLLTIYLFHFVIKTIYNFQQYKFPYFHR
jgi:hypothetical protein